MWEKNLLAEEFEKRSDLEKLLVILRKYIILKSIYR